MWKTIGYIFIGISFVLALVLVYYNTRIDDYARSFAPYTILNASWENYRERFITEEGRVVDDSADGVTTSEGQSYAMLRSVWIDDKETFDLTWQWTKDNLKQDDTWLFGWRWGDREDGTFGLLSDGGNNSASDAESDIALALILASRRWRDERYANESRAVLNSMWTYLTDEYDGKRYLIAGNWAKTEETMVINPSYFSPYAWRLFAEYDTEHDWNSLIDPGYDVLFESSKAGLDTEGGIGLPPDWIMLDKTTGAWKATNLEGLSTDYSFDAMRVPWRIAIDYSWFGEERAMEYLKVLNQPLENYFVRDQKLINRYRHDGLAMSENENPTMYATWLASLSILNKELANRVYQEKILRLYSNAEDNFVESLPYYEQNWLWFGTAYYFNFLDQFN